MGRRARRQVSRNTASGAKSHRVSTARHQVLRICEISSWIEFVHIYALRAPTARELVLRIDERSLWVEFVDISLVGERPPPCCLSSHSTPTLWKCVLRISGISADSTDKQIPEIVVSTDSKTFVSTDSTDKQQGGSQNQCNCNCNSFPHIQCNCNYNSFPHILVLRICANELVCRWGATAPVFRRFLETARVR